MKIVILLFLASLSVAAGDRCCEAKLLPKSRTVEKTIPKTVVIDQNGRQHLFSDLIGGRTVAINFIFTTCTTVCPLMGVNFSSLQDELPGEDFRLISISLDPRVDTPARIHAWGQKYGRDSKWTLLTGEKHEIESLLKALGAFTPLKESHAPIMMIGSGKHWTLTSGLASPETVLKLMTEAGGAP